MTNAFPPLAYRLPGFSEEDWDEALLGEAQAAALRYFEDNRDQVWAALFAELQATVEGWEEADDAREAERRRAARELPPEHEEALYGERIEDSRGGFFESYFDARPDDDDDDMSWEPPERPPFGERFSLHTVVFLETYKGRSGRLLGFLGTCDWDEEHGLGVVMDGTRVLGIGAQDEVR